MLVVVVRTVVGLAPSKVLPVPDPNKEAVHKSIVMVKYNDKTCIKMIEHKMYILFVVAVPKVKFPVGVVLDVAPNVRVFVVAGEPKLRPVNTGADVVGVENKLGAVVEVTVLDPRRPLLCTGVDVGGVPNPKLRLMDVVGVDRAPNVNALDVVVGVPNDVLPKPVAGLNNNLQLKKHRVFSSAKNNFNKSNLIKVY